MVNFYPNFSRKVSKVAYSLYDFDAVNHSGNFHPLASTHFKFLKEDFMPFSPSKMPIIFNENHHFQNTFLNCSSYS